MFSCVLNLAVRCVIGSVWVLAGWFVGILVCINSEVVGTLGVCG
jgi:hypothetical protein